MELRLQNLTDKYNKNYDFLNFLRSLLKCSSVQEKMLNESFHYVRLFLP